MKLPDSLNLYVEGFLSEEDAQRQQRSAQIILDRLEKQPGMILGDEVGMGKTFVALAAASAHIVADGSRPVVVMVPPGVVGKWRRDAETFRTACLRSDAERSRFRVATAESGVDFLKLLDDPESVRASLIVLSHGALHRKLADKWVKLAVLQAAIKGRHGVVALRQRLARFAPMVLRHGYKVDEHYALYLKLLETTASQWKPLLVNAGWLDQAADDPVPQLLLDTLPDMDLNPVFERVVEVIPERVSKSLDSRIKLARSALDSGNGGVLPEIWRVCLKHIPYSFPLLVLDEAHRARNAGTQLSALLSATREDLNTVGGQLTDRFERMLFLTATPFQLGHAELRNVLSRFDSVDWQSKRAPAMSRESFGVAISTLHQQLDAMQLAAERLERAWKKLIPQDVEEAEEVYGVHWWLWASDGEDPECRNVTNERIRSVMLTFFASQGAIRDAELSLRPWVLRHSRSNHLPAPSDSILRRVRIEGADVQREANGEQGEGKGGGLKVGADNCLPFLLGARVTTLPDCPKVFGEGLASSYEALLDTRREEAIDTSHDGVIAQLGSGAWYTDQLRMAARSTGAQGYQRHPKMKATIDLAMALWRQGEKVLVFCHYRETGAALHRYLSQAMIDEIESRACQAIGCESDMLPNELRRLADYFDRDRPAARDVLAILDAMIEHQPVLFDPEIRADIHDIILRFLRTPTFLVRFADLSVKEVSQDWVDDLFDRVDASGLSLRQVIKQFLDFLSKRANPSDRQAYLDALKKLQTGTHAGPEVDQSMTDDETQAGGRVRLVANVRRVYGDTRDETRERIMLTFNTPFYPEILIASSVMAEGVDLHLNCRHVIHHDLDWNPSSLEQRTGRIDRLGSKAERSGKSIRVYLPYVEGCQDEKLYRVVMDRERWFGVVMGAEESMSRVLRANAWEIEKIAEQPPVPLGMVDRLRMKLGSA
jgi:ERCC4-related helicase